MAEIKTFPKARVNSYISKNGRVTSFPQSGRLPRVPSVGTPANATINSGKYAYENKPRSPRNLIKATDKARIDTLRQGMKPKLVSVNKFAYGAPKTTVAPSTGSRIAGALKGVGGAVAKGLRAVSPIGAFAAGMSPSKLGDGKEAKPSGPLMKGNAPKPRGPGASMAASKASATAKANANSRSAVHGKMGPSSTQKGGGSSKSTPMGPSRGNSGGPSRSMAPSASTKGGYNSSSKSTPSKSTSGGKMGASSSQSAKSSGGSKSYGGPR